MPTTETTTPVPVRLDVDAKASAFSRALAHLDKATTKQLDQAGIEPRLRELVRLRASQLNGCAYCVDLHARDARAIGETEQRLNLVAVFREAGLFTERERAALAFTEAVTLMARDHVPDAAWAAVAEHFSEGELGALVALVTTINAWNAVGVSTRAWPVEMAA
jgi:AhpD family alkylhydroperoxidase